MTSSYLISIAIDTLFVWIKEFWQWSGKMKILTPFGITNAFKLSSLAICKNRDNDRQLQPHRVEHDQRGGGIDSVSILVNLVLYKPISLVRFLLLESDVRLLCQKVNWSSVAC